MEHSVFKEVTFYVTGQDVICYLPSHSYVEFFTLEPGYKNA